MKIVRSPKDVLSGLIFLALALVLTSQTWNLEMGTSVRMGPGYFPLLLSGILALLGVIVLVKGLRVDGEAPGQISWRGLILIVLGVVLFGALLRPFGTGPAMAVATFTASIASQKFRLPVSLAIAATMTLFTWAVFIKGLGLPIPMLGPMLGGY